MLLAATREVAVPLEAGDELLFVTGQNVERELAKLLGCVA